MQALARDERALLVLPVRLRLQLLVLNNTGSGAPGGELTERPREMRRLV
jgi:hypothetical protein